MKDINTFINENEKSATFTLSAEDLDKIMYSLAFTAGWGDEVSSYDYPEYKKLWYELKDGVKKSFPDNDIIPENWYDYELSHRGQCRHLD